ncbi:flagellar M-ring protein FliF [Paraneptunicella aestuarii]|uniref:flagellar basal-body MS-ring/collar protein FliF n=1 Tax=Paraneptunicella aestuarii TaxID=2831148 RepID=UPI001E3A2466|nr:flagellar basal-body MS-ring/collar protein FliF [Paraneptunicella aestuarii]UAA38169.1 flagellar M-ring protein FliF [Paraneptunicella aestuarii]
MAEATGTELAVTSGVDSLDSDLNTEQKSGFMEALGSVDMLRQIVLVIALVICVAIAIFIVIWAQEPDYRPLAKMPTEELIETLDYLDQNEIPYRLEGNTIYVTEDQFRDIRLGLTRQGINQDPKAGDEIIMQDMGFGVSQRVEKERLKHAREQQISRTIEEMSSVSRAKVLLALPKENVFARREKQGSATVVITMRRGSILSGEEVDAVVDIVASAVQGLEPSRVTVTDNNGRLLNSGSQDSLSARSRKEYEIEKQREKEYLEKIDSILIPVLGMENYTAQVDVTMDFTSVEQTQKRYNPDLPAVRSEMTMENNTVGSVVAGIPGALTNQPPLDSTIPQQATGSNSTRSTPGSSRKEATRNYELDTTISHTKQQTGVIRRLSVSVAVDYLSTTDAEGNPTAQPRSQEELLNLRRLLQGGIGFDVTRGDSLEVVSIPFSRVDDSDMIKQEIWEQAWFMRAVKWAVGGLVIIVLMLAIVKPMLKRLLYPEDTTEADEYSMDEGLDLGDETISMLSQEFDEGQVGFSPDGSLMLPDLHKDEDVLKVVRALVANEPELSAQVVRGWMMMDE